MAVVAVTFDGNRLSDADSLTDWYDSDGKAAELEPDYYYQGSNSVSEKVRTGLGIGYEYTAGLDMATTPRLMLYKHIATNFGVLNNEGSTGGILEMGSGGTFRSDYYRYYVVGGDTYPPSRGWLLSPIDVNVTAYRDETVGTAPTLTAITCFLWYCTFSDTSKSENVAMDAVDVYDSGEGLSVIGGTGSDDPATFESFLEADEGTTTNRWGLISAREKIEGIIPPLYILGTLTMGNTGAVEFSDSNAVLVFPNGLVNTGAFGMRLGLEHADTVIDFTNCTFTSTGRDNKKLFFDTELNVDAGNELVEFASPHELRTGEAVLYSLEGNTGSLGPSDGTEYWVEAETTSRISFHTSRQGAMTSGTPVALSAITAGDGELNSIRRQPYVTPHLTVTGAKGSATITSCLFNRFGDMIMTNSSSFLVTTFVAPKSIIPNGAPFTDCVFNGATTVAGEQLMTGTITEFEQFSDCDFTAGDWGGHGWRVIGSAGTLDSVGVTWTSYGPDPEAGDGHSFDTETDVDGTNDEIDYTGHEFTTGDPVFYSVYDPIAGTQGTEDIGLVDDTLYYIYSVGVDSISVHRTLSASVANVNAVPLVASTAGNGETHSLYSATSAIVNATSGSLIVNVADGDSPSIRNVGASTTNVVNTITLTVTPVVAGTEIRVYYTGTNVEMAGVENTPSTSYNLSLLAGVAVDIVVLCYDPPRIPVRIVNRTFNTSQELDPFQREDRNFENP